MCYEVILRDNKKIGGLESNILRFPIGIGVIVEIDEAKIGKRKYNRGRAVDGQWIFGGIERGSDKLFIECVDKRDHDTLIPLIQKYILPGKVLVQRFKTHKGTTILTDGAAVYRCLPTYGYVHHWVNHSEEFVGPNGEHTKSIESTWYQVKKNLPRNGTRKYLYQR